ncbi:MAG TPA: carboxymuconolactone decarboxylase family protein [Burkholderiales bacterium]
MPRIPYFDLEQAPEEIKQHLASRHPLNIYRMLAHATTAAPGFLRLGRALLRESELDPRLRELAILRVGILSGAAYEVHQHKRVARLVGLEAEKIDAVARGAAAPVYDALEREVLAFTDEVVRNVKASDAVFHSLHRKLGDRRIVELLLTIGFYMMVCRFLENLEVEIEPPGTVEITSLEPNKNA